MSESSNEQPVLREPAEGVPPVVDTAAALAEAVTRLAAGSGPVAIDAERASGHRYGQNAYLVQIRREGGGTHLVDPIAVPALDPLAESLREPEWILHAATQDLPCLGELGLRPAQLFDTELAARILGLPRVGLAGLTEDVLGVGLAKGHGAADWSRRPLPPDWLNYAALDVELLAELREDLLVRLDRAGRVEWAQQEFQFLLTWQPKVPRDPWRRAAGRLREPRQLATVREMWQVRDAIARAADQPVGRIMKDAVMAEVVQAAPQSSAELGALPVMKPQRRRVHRWWEAIERARALPEAELPPRRAEETGPPPQRAWERRDPEAATRLVAVRAAVTQRAEELAMPTEVLISPDPVRGLVWNAGGPLTETQVRDSLAEAGVRPWQVDNVAALIAAALA